MDEYGGFADDHGLNSLFTSDETPDQAVMDDFQSDADAEMDSEALTYTPEDYPADPQLEPHIDADMEQEPELVEDGVYGNAYEWRTDWFFQQVDGYCGPTSAAIIVNEYFDAGIADPQLMVDKAYELGLTNDISQGMYMADVQTLLESSGVPCENVHGSMEDLAQRLEAGYGVIAFVDSGEVWGLAEDATLEDSRPDHFLVVTEINTNTGMVTLADPGSPSGNGMQMPIAEFEDAWADSNFEMIATTTADPELGGSVNENQQLAIANVTRSEVIQ